MKVIYRGCNEPIYQSALKLSHDILHAGFTASEISESEKIPVESVLEVLCRFQEYDICTRFTEDWTTPPLSGSDQWVLIAHCLTIGREYTVLGIEADTYRIINDCHDPVLYHPYLFHVSEATEPNFWTCTYGEDQECYCYPQSWSASGFFEAYHDGDSTAKHQFWNDLATFYPEAFHEHREYAKICEHVPLLYGKKE